MKKVVIIAEYFAPINGIASIRPTKLAKYFKVNSGYNITVVTRRPNDYETTDPILEKDLKYIDNFIIGNESVVTKLAYSIVSAIKRKQANNYKANKKGIIKNMFFCLMNCFHISAILVAEKGFVKSAIKNSKIYTNQYDVIFSTRSPYNNHVIGKSFKKYNSNALWIADFRDPVITLGTSMFRKWFFSGKEKLIKTADIITGVTYACIQEFEKIYKNKLHTIPNGFDRDDLRGIDLNNIDEDKMDKFTLVYTGSLYKGRSDLSIVFRAIGELINEGEIKKFNLIIKYAGSSSQSFIEQASLYGLSDIVDDRGYIDRAKSLEMQKSCSILLLATWNSIGNTGIITGKFLEYLMTDKPIICIVTGNLANSQTKEMFEKANCGVVWEEANSNIDYPMLKEYILKQYKYHMNKQPLEFNPYKEYIEQFNYKNIAQQFIDLIEGYR